mgnify:CR=1 FL=1
MDKLIVNYEALASHSLYYFVNALDNICRFQGRTTFFYSVLHHSYYVSLVAQENNFDKTVQFVCLFHDFPEVIIGDWHRVVKKHVSKFYNVKLLEDEILDFFLKKFTPEEVYEDYLKRKEEVDYRVNLCDKFFIAKEVKKFDLDDFIYRDKQEKDTFLKRYENALKTNIVIKPEKNIKERFMKRYAELVATSESLV